MKRLGTLVNSTNPLLEFRRWILLLFSCFPLKPQRNTAEVTIGNPRFLIPDLILVTSVRNCVTDGAEGVQLNKNCRLKVSLILEKYSYSVSNISRSLLCVNHPIILVSCHLRFSYNSNFCFLQLDWKISELMPENKTS
jgi:hypothetical protein